MIWKSVDFKLLDLKYNKMLDLETKIYIRTPSYHYRKVNITP